MVNLEDQMPEIGIYLVNGLVILALFILLWLISLKLSDSSIVDIAWGSSFIVVAWLTYLLTPDGAFSRRLLVCGLVTIWGLRLSAYLLYRNWGRGEDFRYARWRRQGGTRWWWQSLFKVFLLQGLLVWVISAPLAAAQLRAYPEALTWLDGLGALIWGVGFIFESLGDWQLVRFKSVSKNEDKVMDRGLWRYSRHPNYFGEAVLWWGYFLIALAAGGGQTVFSPILMTFLLIRVSGVAMLERTLKEEKPGYREYILRTSAFIPLPPRNDNTLRDSNPSE
jgi:steroid 5-alpha reductase family enzyme